jgi:hypothetical protein
MSNFTLEIFDTKHTLEIETAIANTFNNLTIETSSDKSVDITVGYAGTVVYASDILGLDSYLSNFIDQYSIDCGSP